MKHILLVLFLLGSFSSLPTRATGPAVCVDTSVIVAKVAMGALALIYTRFSPAKKPPIDPIGSFGVGVAFWMSAVYDIYGCAR